MKKIKPSLRKMLVDEPEFKPDTCPSCFHPQHVEGVCQKYNCLCEKEKAIKADDGKPTQYRLLAWDAIPEILEVYRYGLAKGYVKDSWRNVAAHRYEDALNRHLNDWMLGEDTDKESGLRHLAHIAWNSLALIVLVPLTRKKNLY